MLKEQFLELLARAFESAEGREILARTLPGLLAEPTELSPKSWSQSQREYPELGFVDANCSPSQRNDIVFITARFRSGSTLLWNLFRQLPNCTAYYEPFNERKWFDAPARGTRVDDSHRNIVDYWQEYAGLEDLNDTFDTRWNERQLYMGANDSAPMMLKYLNALIEHAAHRPILQFNRMDFRLPWLRKNFPRAKIVHLVRNPRASWYSSLMSKEPCPREVSITEFSHYDELYLLHWMRDLKICFPILGDSSLSHPYDIYYCIWRLSHAFGCQYADYRVTFESLVSDPETEMANLLSALELDASFAGSIAQLIEAPKRDAWLTYADDTWFREHEERCHQLIKVYYPSLEMTEKLAENENAASR